MPAGTPACENRPAPSVTVDRLVPSTATTRPGTLFVPMPLGAADVDPMTVPLTVAPDVSVAPPSGDGDVGEADGVEPEQAARATIAMPASRPGTR